MPLSEKLDIAELRSALAPLLERAEITLAVAFGSTVAGAARRSSDVDLAFLGDAPLDLLDLTNTAMRLLRFSEVDVVDLRRASPTLQMVVAKKGRLLYERTSGAFASFCSLAARRFQDAAKNREAQKRSIREFLRQRGL